MLVRVLQQTRFALRRTALGKGLRRLGLSSVGRGIYERRVLAEGTHRADLLGLSLRFAVESPRDIKRIDALEGEEQMARCMLAAARPGDVWFDVGANVGVLSLMLARGVAGATVHAFEPEERARRLLTRNVELNRADNVRVHPFALGSTDGSATFHVDATAGSGAHSLVAGNVGASRSVEVEVRAGDGFSDSIGRAPDALKIDVEGAELEVLRGLAGALERQAIRELFIEVHPDPLERQGESPETMRAWLAERGYRRAWSDRRRHQIHEHYRRETEDGPGDDSPGNNPVSVR